MQRNFILALALFLSSSLAMAHNHRIVVKLQISEEDAKSYEYDNLKKLPVDIPLFNHLYERHFSNAFLKIDGQKWIKAKELHTRGQSCMTAFRKCFAVKLASPISLNLMNEKQIKLKRFNLVSMTEDLGLSSLDLGHRFYRSFGLFPLSGDYVELFINDTPKGLYYLIEAPNHYLKNQKKAVFAGRLEGLSAKFKTSFYEKNTKESSAFSEIDYLKAYNDLPQIANKGDDHGVAAYINLKKRMDIDSYLTYLAINTILMNGDYADDVYFYSIPRPGQMRPYFNIMAWDPEALFKRPHMFPQNFLFWKRRLKKTLFYSMESKLDRQLAKNKYINRLLATKVKHLLQTEFTPSNINTTFEKTRNRLLTYLKSPTALLTTEYNCQRNGVPYTTKEVLNILNIKKKILIQNHQNLTIKAEKIFKY